MKTLFLVILKSISAILVLLVFAIGVLIFSGITVNLDFMRGGVETAASSALGRDVTIEGPVELEFSNWPAIDISDVKIANVEGGNSPTLLNAGFVRMQLGIFLLLKGEVNIADISAENVTLNLESDSEGSPNWVFGQSGKTVPGKEKKLQEETPQDVGNTGQQGQKNHIQFTGLNHLSLQQIAVNYTDAALDKSFSFLLESMEGTAAEGQPIELNLDGLVEDKNYQLNLQGDSITDLLDKSKPWGFKTKGEIFGKQVAGKGNMHLNGEQPEVHLALGVRDIDVGVILATLGLVEGMQASLGDVGMDITVTGDSLKEILNKSSMIFVVKDGNWTVSVPNTESSFNINGLDGKISVEQGNNISLALDGAIEEVPVKLLISGAPLVEYVTHQEELPLSIKAELLETNLSFDSDIKLPISSANMSVRLKIDSRRIDRMNGLLKLDLPPVGPVSLESKLDIKPQVFDLSALNLKVGESSLNGSFNLNLAQEKPILDISLVSELLQLDNFITAQADQVKDSSSDGDEDNTEEEKAEPENDDNSVKSRHNGARNLLSYEALNSIDADIKIAAKNLLSGEDELGSAKVKLALKEGRLQIEPIALEIPGGHFEASLDYTPTATDVALKIRADIEDFDLGVLIRRLKPGADMGGKIYMDLDLDSIAADPASIMANASGHFDFGLVPKNFSAGIVDLWAVNLLSAIMDKSTEKDQSEMNCVVVRTRLEQGVMSEEAIYLDTSNMRIAGKMDIDFNTRELEIKLAPKAKNPEFFSLAIPIQVKGSLDDFGLKIGVLRMAGQIVSFLTSPIHVPIRRVFTEESPEDGVEACTYAWTVTAEGAGNSEELTQ